MKVIFTISPNYLGSIYKESKKYNFRIQGYTQESVAIKRLVRTNIMDILGFCYVADELPEDLTDLKELLRLLDLVCESHPRKFTFALLDYSNLKKLAEKGKTLHESYPYLKITTLPNLEDITDDVVNRMIFGPILLDNYHAYYVEGISDDKDTLSRKMFHVPRLEYRPIIKNKFLDILSLPVMHESVEETLQYDSYYLDNRTDENLEFLRRMQIMQAFGEDVTETLKGFINELVRIDNPEMFCHLSAIANYLLEGSDE